jgi:nitrite reductase/ring-hydroxylating ferredoxin subunit
MIRNLLLLFLSMRTLMACTPDLSDDPIPPGIFSPLTINLNLSAYQDLKIKGFIEVNDIGVRGVILYKVNESTYHAYERNCSYHPNDACATVSVDASTLFMIDYCCNSTFDFDTGNPTGGPAWRPLRRYETSLTGQTLTITDIIVE